MQKQAWTWTTPRLSEPARLVRWGHFGTPVLIFPTAGGDYEEIERFHLITSLETLITNGQIKAYSVDGIGVRAWLAANTSVQERQQLQFQYDTYLYEEVLKRIRQDCHDEHIEPVLVGASLGAGVAINSICRHPDSYKAAIALSGVFDMLDSTVRALSSPPLERLRQRQIILGCGEGDYEFPDDSRRLADQLAAQGIPCRLTLWGRTHDHTWKSWREMLPRILREPL